MPKTISTTTRFKEYHKFLVDTDPLTCKIYIEEICQALGFVERTFYRKLENPLSLSPAEKKAIAAVYRLPIHFIFPEMEAE